MRYYLIPDERISPIRVDTLSITDLAEGIVLYANVDNSFSYSADNPFPHISSRDLKSGEYETGRVSEKLLIIVKVHKFSSLFYLAECLP